MWVLCNIIMETMTYKEKILAEIERLKHYVNIPYDRDMFDGVCLIESFINSLPAEQPIKISDYLSARAQISDYLYKLISDQAHRGAPMLQYGDNRINEEVDLILKMAIRELNKKVPAEQPSEDLEEAANLYANKQGLELKPFARRFFIAGANWKNNKDEQILSNLYDDCSLLKDSLDKVTTGNLSHRIGNVKFSITGMQVLIKQAMEDR